MFKRDRWNSGTAQYLGNFSSLALLAWSTILLAVAVYSYMNLGEHTVYPTYASAAKNWWSAQNIYADEEYRYSPLFAIAMTPFTALPEKLGGSLWKVCNAMFYATGLWAWARRVLPARLDANRLGLFFLLALPTSLISIYNGQANLFMVGALLWGLAYAVDQRWVLAAGWIAIGTLIKAYPLALALLLAALYPLRFSARFVGALGLGFFLPLVISSLSHSLAQSITWLTVLYDTTGVRPEKYRSIDQLWRIYYEPLSPHAYLALQVLAGAAVLGLCLLQARRRPGRRELITSVFTWFACWVVLFGPTTEEATFAVITPAIAWSLLDAFMQPASLGARWLLLVSMFMMGPLATDVLGPTVRVFATAKGCLPFGALLFLGYLLAQEARSFRAGTAGAR